MYETCYYCQKRRAVNIFGWCAECTARTKTPGVVDDAPVDPADFDDDSPDEPPPAEKHMDYPEYECITHAMEEFS